MKLYTFEELDIDIQCKMIKRFITMNDLEELKWLKEKRSVIYELDDIPDFAEEGFIDCGRVFDEKGENLSLYMLELN